MKKFIVLFVLITLIFNVRSSEDSAQVVIVDSLNIGQVLMPAQLKAALTQIDSTNEVVFSPVETQKIHLDTQRIIIYDTVKLVEQIRTDKPIKEESFTDKLMPSPSNKDTVTPLGEIISFGNIFWSLIILLSAYFVIKALVTIIDRFAEKSTNYRITLKSLSPFVRIIGWTVAVIWIVEGVFELSNDKLFAFVASAGLAIGFASQDILKNIFGGIMILFDKPFQVGDKIEVGEIYGEVKEIGLRSTRIITKDDSLVSVPNAEVVNTAVSNSNAGEANCQVVAEIFLPIDTDTNAARLIATEAAQISRYIYLNKPIVVLFFNEVKMDRSYLKMRVKAYVSDIRNEFAFKSDMTEIIMKEFLKEGIFNKNDVQ
ncbi:MAG: small-conductance mechanosensitive channel [Vicingaceae bacterium]|jgi:small-conductance mechanosensitive channel